jgi:DNA replication and repair protein RecF
MNGTGKTNLLDAIYYLSFTKSFFSRPDAQNVQRGKEGFRIEGEHELNNKQQKIVCILRENNRKEFLVNDEAYKKFSAHIGKLPCVMIAPDDIALIAEGSEERRRFIDTILSQTIDGYLQNLIAYTTLLQQRNSFLKQAAEQGNIDDALLEILSNQLSDKGTYLFEQRKIFLDDFLPLANSFYKKIAGKDDAVIMKYESSLLHTNMIDLLKANRQKDLLLQRTTAGIHKDDIEFLMDDVAFKAQASQGQRKSLLFALKLAEWESLKRNKGFAPILLLDDVFEKLDEQRMHNLLHWVCNEGDGQVFITDTHKERLEVQLQQVGVDFQLIDLSQ